MSLNLDKSTWQTVRFKDVVRNVNDMVRDAAAVGIDRVIALEHLDGGELEIARWGDDPSATSFTKRVRPGQTLFGKRRAYQRKAAYAEFDAITSGDILVFEPARQRLEGPSLIGELLPFLVQSERFFEHALGTSAGSLSPRTNWRDLAEFEFAVPPLDEQRRLADLLWAAEHHRREIANLLAAASKVVEELRAEFFARPGERVRADKMFEITMGRQRSPIHASGDHMVPYLRSANVTASGIDVSDVYEMNFTPSEQEKFALHPGDVLVSEGSASATAVGMPAVYRGEVAGVACFQNTLLRLRPVVGYSTSEFVEQWCRWAFESREFLKASSGTNIHHIGSNGASKMLVPATTFGEQRAFLGQIIEGNAALSALRTELAALQLLRSSLMKEVFE